MANQSILAAFERMWQHTVALVGASRKSGAETFSDVTPTAASSLTSAGWYHMSMIVNGISYNFGLVYWDGSSNFRMVAANGYTAQVMAYNGTASFIIYKDGSTFYDSYTMYAAKLG